MTPLVITVEHLSKQYDLGVVGTGTLSRDLERWWARARGKPDPYAIIGHEQRPSKKGESILALDDVSFTVRQGEALGIIGRNGAGKSTLLKILSRITAPTSGKVKVKGRIGSLLEIGTGFHPELTGRENVYLNGAILGMKKEEVARKFDEIIDFSGVEKYIDTPVKRYSSGMYVRLAFSVAAHLDAELLIMDEVLAVGDTEFQKKCLSKMSKASVEGRTVLFVSHNLAAVRNLCQNVIWLDKGFITASGPSESVITSYLNKSSADSNFVSLVDFSETSHNNQIRLFNVSSRNSTGDIASTFERNEPFSLQIEYSLNDPPQELRVSFQLFTPDGIIVLTAPDMDSSNLSKIPRNSGRYLSECRFPGSILNAGFYSIRVIFDIPGGIKPIHLLDNILNIKIVQTEKFSGTYYQHPGIIFLRLPWKISRIGDSD